MILDRSKNYLDIFVRPFEIDTTLLKYRKEGVEPFNQVKYSDFTTNTNSLSFPFNNVDVGDEIDGNVERRRKTIFSKLFKKRKREKRSEIDVLEFFEEVKLCTEESKQTYIERTEPYLAAIKQAKELGQVALVDKLMENLKINKYESILFAAGYGKKIEERQMVEFARKSDKGIRLVYIKNFTRPIPQDVATKKLALDKLEVFDNYCVLFYDTTGDMSDKTALEKEIERQKKADPILFGMVKGSRALYYVADWTDKYCDLTLSEFLKVSGLGESNIEIGNEIKIEGL